MEDGDSSSSSQHHHDDDDDDDDVHNNKNNGNDGSFGGDDDDDDDDDDSVSFPALEDADIDDLSSSASVVSDSSESVTIASDEEDDDDEEEEFNFDDDDDDDDDNNNNSNSNNTGTDQHYDDDDHAPSLMAAIAISSAGDEMISHRVGAAADGQAQSGVVSRGAPANVSAGGSRLQILQLQRQQKLQQQEQQQQDQSFLDYEEELASASDEDIVSSGDYKRRRGSGEHVNGAAKAGNGETDSRCSDGETGLDDDIGEPIIVPLKAGSDHSSCADGEESRPPHHAPYRRPQRMSIRDFDGDDDEPGRNTHKKLGRRLSRSQEAALERNAVRRQSSNDMLRAMQQAAAEVAAEALRGDDDDMHHDPSGDGGFQRRAPARTKSAESFGRRAPARTKSADSFSRRRPPPRTKSGEGSFLRRPPQRTKSGAEASVGTLSSRSGGDLSIMMDAARAAKEADGRRESSTAFDDSDIEIVGPVNSDFVILLKDDENDDTDEKMASEASPTAHAGMRRTREVIDRESALRRNAARRQKSSDMLSAMRDATKRNAPSRASSSMAAFQRRAPARSISGMEQPNLGNGENGRPSRRPPPRTKSSGLRGSSINQLPAHLSPMIQETVPES